MNDPYVQRAKKEGYRGRAAYKILELDDKYGFLKPGCRVVDLGCAPGGWCQVAVARVNALGENPKKPVGTVLGVDLQEVEPIPGAELHQLDFLADDADDKVKGWLGGRADVVMSDMAAASSGHKATDHLRIVALVEAGAQAICPGGMGHRDQATGAGSATEAASSKPLNRFFLRWTSNREIAAGVTPEMRDAWPRVSGRCLLSFCRTSMPRAVICM